MTTKLTWYGHGTWGIETDKHRILLDPFFDDNPSSPIKSSEVKADFILVSHGHFDHIADAAEIAKRNEAQTIAIYEVAQWLQENQSVENTLGMNIGGTTKLPFGSVKMTMAHHSSQLPDGSYGGSPAGFLLTISDKRIYFACDTSLFLDMKLYEGVDVAVLPIGDLFTMGPEDSIEAIKLIAPQKVLPAHYNTWPPIEQNAQQWANDVKAKTTAEPVVLQPGESFEI